MHASARAGLRYLRGKMWPPSYHWICEGGHLNLHGIPSKSLGPHMGARILLHRSSFRSRPLVAFVKQIVLKKKPTKTFREVMHEQLPLNSKPVEGGMWLSVLMENNTVIINNMLKE